MCRKAIRDTYALNDTDTTWMVDHLVVSDMDKMLHYYILQYSFT